MKEAMTRAATEVCGIRRGPPRHRETCWWSKEVVEVVKFKRTCFRKCQKSGLAQDKGSGMCETA